MAWLIGDGFDFYNAAADQTLPGSVWASGSPPTLTAITRFGVGMGTQAVGTSTLTSITFANSTTIYVNYAFISTIAFTSGTTGWMGFTLMDGGTAQVGVFIVSGGTIKVTTGAVGATQLATSPFTLVANVWNHFQFKIVINNTTGSVECRLNGNTSNDWTATGINTRNGTTNPQVNSFKFDSVGATTGVYDDLYIFNDQGAAPNTWQGDVRALQLMPTSDSSITWTPNSGGNNFSRVSELREDGDTSYVSTSTVNNVDQYGTGSLSTTPNSIIAVQTKMFTRMDDVGPHTVKSRLTSSGVTSDSSNLALSSSYQMLQQVYATDPNTSAAWTSTAANAATI